MKSSLIVLSLSSLILSAATFADNMPPHVRGIIVPRVDEVCQSEEAMEAAKAAADTFHPIYRDAVDAGRVPGTVMRFGACSTRQLRDIVGPRMMGIVASPIKCGLIYTFADGEGAKEFAEWTLSTLAAARIHMGGVPVCAHSAAKRVGLPIRPLINGIRVPR